MLKKFLLHKQKGEPRDSECIVGSEQRSTWANILSVWGLQDVEHSVNGSILKTPNWAAFCGSDLRMFIQVFLNLAVFIADIDIQKNKSQMFSMYCR